MHLLLIVLRFIHVLSAVYWAGTIFFFVSFLEPSLRSLGPDGGKVMIRFFERGYLDLLPRVALTAIASGLALIWIVSDGFQASWMRSRIGMALSTGGLSAIIALILGFVIMRPAAIKIWELSKQMPAADEAKRNELMAQMGALRQKTVGGARLVAVFILIAATLMATARYL